MAEWEWNDDKARRNLEKHRIAFETAVLVFDDVFALSEPDPHPDGDRWRTIGAASHALLFVVHTIVVPDGSARIISARKASRNERKRYEELRVAGDHA